MIQYLYIYSIFLVLLISFSNTSSNHNGFNINIIKENSDDVLDSSDSSNQFYPIELDASCQPLITDNNICAKYLNYNKIYTSNTQLNQNKSSSIASQYIEQINIYGNSECNQEIVFKTICTYLFPECLVYKEVNGDIEFKVAIRTCYEECYQSVEWCSYGFNCNQNLNGYSVPLFPVNSTKYNFASYGYENLDLACANPFASSSSSSSSSNNNTTPSPTPTPLPEKSHHSKLFKFIISFAIIFPIVTIIALIIYNFNRGKLTKKKLSNLKYEDDYDETRNNNYNNNIITPTGNSIVNEYTPLMGH